MSRSLRISGAILALLVAVAFAPPVAIARSHATPTPTATPTIPPEDPALTLVARREFVSWQAGVVNLDRYDEKSRPGITPVKIEQTSKALGTLGTLESVQWLGPIPIVDPVPGVKGSYLFKMHCDIADVYEMLTMGDDGKVTGIIFRDKLPQP